MADIAGAVQVMVAVVPDTATERPVGAASGGGSTAATLLVTAMILSYDARISLPETSDTAAAG